MIGRANEGGGIRLRPGGWRRGAVVLTVVAMIAGCGSSDDDDSGGGEASSSGGGGGAAAVDFGDLEAVCGPGDASGATARGVTDSEIRITTMADPGNPFAPGLGQENFDAAEAFVQWCNDAGGILGRQIVLTTRDAMMTDVAAKVIEACATDFMMVGSLSVLPEPGIEPRVGCGLGSIPAGTADPDESRSDLLVTPDAASDEYAAVGNFRAIQRAYPEAVQHYGTMGVDIGPLGDARQAEREAAESIGYETVSDQALPETVDNFRPYVQQLADDGVRALVPSALSQVIEQLIQAANDIGYAPEVMLLSATEYRAPLIEAAAAIEFPPTWTSTSGWPVDMADENPAMQDAISIVEPVNPDLARDNSIYALSSWVLWAVSAKACGSDLTVECVIEEAGSQEAWTAGGLTAPKNLDPAENRPSECVAMLRVTPEGFVYDEEMTVPNEGIFNCDPSNVVEIG